MPPDPTKLTVGTNSNISSAAGVPAITSPFTAKPGTTVGDISTTFAPTPQNPIAPPSYLTQSPQFPAPKTSAGTDTAFGSQNQNPSSTNLSDYLSSPSTTGNGSVVSTNGGNVNGSTGFKINTGGVTSNNVQTGTTVSDVLNQRNQYAQYLQQLAQASQYSPAYIQAYQAAQNAKLNSAALANQINNPEGPGATLGQLETTIQRAQTGNALESASANIALQAQALARQGDIAGAQALVQGYAPQTVAPGSSLVSPATGQETYSGIGGLAGVNAVDTYKNYQEYYPGANIPPYDQTLTPSQNLARAQKLVSTSPQYQAQFLQTYTTPGGGTGLFSKTNTGLLQQNSDGTIGLVSGVAASIGKANSDALAQQVTSYNNTQTAFNTVDTIFGNVTSLMNQYGLNQSGVPLANQIQNKINAGILKPGALAAFKASIQELRTNLAQVISRGGSVAGSTQEAANLVPENLSPSDMGKLGAAIQTNGQSALQQAQNQITQITNNLQGGTTGGGIQQPASGGNVGDSWSNLLTQ